MKFFLNKGGKIFVLWGILLSIFACTPKKPYRSNTQWKGEEGKIKILSTTLMIHDMVLNIGKDHVDAIPLIIGELDPHSYELVKGDDEKFIQAHLIFFNGLGLEHGLTLRRNLEGNSKAISIGDPIFEQEPTLAIYAQGTIDPHIWLDISLWKRGIPIVLQALCHRDPDHAKEYQQNALKFEKKLEEMDAKILASFQQIPPSRRYLVTSHDAFNYFTRRYLSTEEEKKEGGWECRFCAPEGLAPDAQLSLTDIRLLVDHIAMYNISVLFPESNVSQDSLKKITSVCREKNHPIRLCVHPLYGDAMGDSPSYLEMMEHNFNIISHELQVEGRN